MTCDVSVILTASACYEGLSPTQQDAIQIYLLCQWVNVP